MSKSPRNLHDPAGEHATIAALTRRVAALERLYSDPQDSANHMAVARQLRQDGTLSSLVGCSYDPAMIYSTNTLTNNRLSFTGMWVPEVRTVNSIAVGLVAGVGLTGGGNYNGAALYKYDWNAGSPQLILLGRSTGSLSRYVGSVANAVSLMDITLCNSSPSTYGLSGLDADTGVSLDWTIGPGLYYSCTGYSDDGTGTRAQGFQAQAGGSGTGLGNFFNMEFDATAYPVPRFGAVTNAASIPPDVVSCASMTKINSLPWVALLS